ncbi:MAG: hypothetical protein ACLQMH_00260, partial [Solirubrobacteraceae bacterium]
AKELARTAQTTAETYATDHGGSYSGISTAELAKYETGLQLCGTKTPAEQTNACFKEAGVESSGAGYKVVTRAANSGDEFTIVRNASGEISRTCKSEKTGCSGSTSGTW